MSQLLPPISTQPIPSAPSELQVNLTETVPGLEIRVTEQSQRKAMILGRNIGNGYLEIAKVDAQTQERFITAVSTVLGVGKEFDREPEIFFSRGYIAYQIKGGAFDTMEIAAAQKNPELAAQIKAIKDIGEKAEKIAISTFPFRDGAMGPSGQTNPVLGSQADPFVKTVFPSDVHLLNFLIKTTPKLKLNTNKELTDFLENLETAKQIKKKLRQNVHTRVLALEGNLANPAATLAEPEIEKLKNEIRKLKSLDYHLQENWDEHALPIVMAYQIQYADKLEAGTITPLQVAEKINKELGEFYTTKHKGVNSSRLKQWFGKPTLASNYATDVARQFLASRANTAGGRDDYYNFCLKHGDGAIKNEVFADAFTRGVVNAPRKLVGDVPGKPGKYEIFDFEDFVETYLTKDSDITVETRNALIKDLNKIKRSEIRGQAQAVKNAHENQ